MLAVTLHNIPEGMAVGLTFARAAQHSGDAGLLAAAGALALGIGIQNFPEGAAVSLPLREEGLSRRRAFAYGALSGVVEPLFGVLVVLAAAQLTPFMPWLLSAPRARCCMSWSKNSSRRHTWANTPTPARSA